MIYRGCGCGHNGIKAASKLASTSDVAIIVVATTSKEGSDRNTLSFAASGGSDCQLTPPGQDELIQTVAAAADAYSVPTIVAAVAPGAVLMPWKENVSAILLSFMPGQVSDYSL